MTAKFAPASATAIPLYLVAPDAVEATLAKLEPAQSNWARAAGFSGGLSEVLACPAADGTPAVALVGLGSPAARKRGRFQAAVAASKLPEGVYRLTDASPGDAAEVALGWLMESYRFDRYRKQGAAKALLAAPEGIDAKRIETIAACEALVRDLVNTPAADMGPAELEAAAATLAHDFGARFNVTRGDDLLAANLPMIHTVGRASDRAPRLIDMRWGDKGPKLTLVGKGVCFDTGGLDIKPASSMGLMKKDMGGAANVLGLARAIMSFGWPVQLRVLIPAVENAVSGNAFRPQDILTSRKGLTVEINNTDAEGRLVLADALALADEENPDLVISMATLTGAARVAVGPDLAPFFATEDRFAEALSLGARAVHDPVWRMPFHDPYEGVIEPGIADLDNAPGFGMAGSLTAALFLRRFVDAPYMHFDIFAWARSSSPALPKGGVGQGFRALVEALPRILGL